MRKASWWPQLTICSVPGPLPVGGPGRGKQSLECEQAEVRLRWAELLSRVPGRRNLQRRSCSETCKPPGAAGGSQGVHLERLPEAWRPTAPRSGRIRRAHVGLETLRVHIARMRTLCGSGAEPEGLEGGAVSGRGSEWEGLITGEGVARKS